MLGEVLHGEHGTVFLSPGDDLFGDGPLVEAIATGFGDEPVAARQIGVLEYLAGVSKRVAGTFVILGSLYRVPNSINPVRHLDYRFPECGPLAGLESLLSYAGSRWCLIIGWDLPYIDEELLRYIVSQFASGWDAVAFVMSDPRRLHHPCCAGYHGRVLGIVRKKLHFGQLRMQSLLADIRTRTLTPNALQRERLLNANTPEDLRALWSKSPSQAGLGRDGPLFQRASNGFGDCRHHSIGHDSATRQANVSHLDR